MAEPAQHAEHQVRDAAGRVLAAVENQNWLDRPSYRLEHALTFALAALGRHRERVTNVLHGTWLGHPLHPALTSLPTGAIGTAVAMDAAGMLPGHASDLRDASRFALGVGILGSLGAAATGLTDWQHTHEQSRRVGLVHGVLNGVATGLYMVSWRDRRKGRRARGIAGSALGYALTLGSGYLGAALVYGSAAGVDRSGSPADRRRLDAGTTPGGSRRPAAAGRGSRCRRRGVPQRPAVAAASKLVAIAHAEHRQVWDQLTVLLRTPPIAPDYEDEWQAFVTVLDAHAAEEECDLCPAPVDLSEDMLDALGEEMLGRISQLRSSAVEKLHVKGRAALLRSL